MPKRRRQSDKAGPSKSVTISYYINTRKQGNVQVCGKFFMSILKISKFRIQNVSKTFMQTGMLPVEKRGGDRKSKNYADRKENVRTFIKTLQCVESHYTRDKSTRQYFPSDCSVKKLWRAYNKKYVCPQLRVKYHFFWEIFVSDFNISFKTPATDSCSECLRLKSLITTEKNSTEKIKLMTKLRLHKLRAKAFGNLIKDDTDKTVFKFSFDCQKNLVLPKIPDQAAYYSRQLYQYNMTICEGHSKSKQTRDNIHIFAWCENESKKGSNEIASILYHYLRNKDLSAYNEVQLFADGCPGQNKNITVIGMLAHWLFSLSPDSVKFIKIIYPVVGHSYIPPDRVFGNIERVLRKKDSIITPNKYRDIFNQFGQVKLVGTDVPVFNWKDAAKDILKPPAKLHFKFNQTKIFTLKKIKNQSKTSIFLKGEALYKFESCEFLRFLKPGKKLTDMKPEMLPNKVPVKKTKINDVKKLLTLHFGENWETREELNYYKTVIAEQEEIEIENNGEEVDEEALLEIPNVEEAEEHF